MANTHDELEYAGGGLSQETNWWGAFVIGLAGTILVTGIAPVMVTKLGAASVPSIVFITITGVILCLLLAELSAMMPERTGGSPSYAYPAWRIRFPRLAPHVNGITAWAYWLGWFPVAPLNMILASIYIGSLAGLDLTSGFTPISTFIPWWTLGIAIAGIIAFFIPAYLGIRLGTAFATVLGVISMVPLTFVAIGWIFQPGKVDFGELWPFDQVDGTGFFSGLYGHGWFTLYIAFAFLLTWNVIAMEAAACYIGETRNPDKDAKVAMSLEGFYGLFIYTLVPIAFIIVIGQSTLGNPDELLYDPNAIFVKFSSEIFGSSGDWLNWVVGIMLIVALALSALNAIMGCARSLHQMSVDGQFPRWFQHINKHGVPDRAMFFNVLASLAVVLMGGTVEIYTFSNVGYLFSFLPVLVGYYMLRRYRPDARRPFKLPEYFKYVALVLAGIYAFIYFYGGPFYAACDCSLAGKNTLVYYIIGIAVLFAYVPLYWYRKKVEDPKHAGQRAGEAGAPAPGD